MYTRQPSPKNNKTTAPGRHSHRKKSNWTLRRIQRTLCILLPILTVSLIALLALNWHQNRVSQTGSNQLASNASTADTADLPSGDSNDPAQQDGAQDIGSDTDPAAAADKDASDADTSSDTASEDQKDDSEPVTLLFTGDVLLSDYVLENYNNSGIQGVVSPEMLQQLKQADLTIINNEFPFSTRGTQAEDKQFTFRVDPSYVRILTDMGIDIAVLANNHVLDYGADALHDTFDTLEKADIEYVGAGDDLSRASALITKEINGRTFGFLAASRVIPVISWDVRNATPGVFTTYDPALLLDAIKQARTRCDYLTVLVHWGIERDEYPQDYQTQLAEQYIDAGADLIIGAHPHVLQGISYYKEKPIFYSLGNFIFNQEIPQTMAVKVTVTADDDPQIQLIAASASRAYTYVCEKDKKTDIYEHLEQISDGISIDSDGILSH